MNGHTAIDLELIEGLASDPPGASALWPSHRRSSGRPDRGPPTAFWALLRDEPALVEALRHAGATIRRISAAPGRAAILFSTEVAHLLFAQLALLAAGGLRRDDGLVVYFPTRAGGIDAHLALLVVLAFLDRLSGHGPGVVAWTRFPLGLLGAAETDRLCRVIGYAELVRLESDDPRLRSPQASPLAIGFHSPTAHGTGPGGEARTRACPACGTDSVRIVADEAGRVIHTCVNRGCGFPAGALPIVDGPEIPSARPSVVVGALAEVSGLPCEAPGASSRTILFIPASHIAEARLVPVGSARMPMTGGESRAAGPARRGPGGRGAWPAGDGRGE